MAYLVAGALIALIGIAAVFFVLRRKSVEKRSMYSARREQIEHKVRAARQRTLTPHGHVERSPEPVAATAAAPASPFDQPQAQPRITYDVAAYQAPPAAPPAPPTPSPQPAAEPMPWEQPTIPAPAPSFDYPSVAQPEPFSPAPAPPSEPVWTPAPIPAQPLPPAETIHTVAPVAAAASSTAAGGWEIVSTGKDSEVAAAPASRKKDKGAAATGSWQLASGDAPGSEAEEQPNALTSGTVRAVAQYAVLVVGLVMVLIGVLVMVANSHVT